MNQTTPRQLVWRRFRKNRLAFAGLLLVATASFMAAFCYLLIPDSTPDANRMCLPLNNRPPGFTATMMLLRKNVPETSTGIFEKLFTGAKDNYEAVPVDTVRWEGGRIRFVPFGAKITGLPEQTYSLADAVWALEDPSGVTINGSLVQGKGVSGEMLKADQEELAQSFFSNQVIRRTFYLGTDRYGRDMLSRLLAGTRVTFMVGLVAVVISLFIGLVLGGMAGYFRGRVDQFMLWLINVIWSVPTLLLVISITLVLGKGFVQVFIAVGLTMWVDVARIVRGQLFAVRELDFVSAGKTMGFSNARILFRHMLPNVIGPVLVVAASNFSTAVLLEAGLSFLGIGAQPPTPSWGSMIKENYGYIILPDAAYLAVLPGVAILLLTLAFTFVANGLRDAMDAKQGLLG